MADLHMEKGKLKKITVKKERVRGKVLAVTDESIELEGYAAYPSMTIFMYTRPTGISRSLEKETSW